MTGNRSGRLRLTREMRLNRSSDFAEIKARGRRLVRGCLIANWKEREGFSRIGFITSRKIGNAVTRVRARRLMREAFRLHQYDLARTVDLVLIARPSIAGKSFGQVEQDYLEILRQGNLWKKTD